MNRCFTVSIEELLQDPGRATEVLPEEIPGLICKLAAAQAVLAARLAEAPLRNTGRANEHDELLDVKQAAKRLHVPVDFLYRNSKKLPFTVRIGDRLRFSAKEIEKYIKRNIGR